MSESALMAGVLRTKVRSDQRALRRRRAAISPPSASIAAALGVGMGRVQSRAFELPVVLLTPKPAT